MTIYCLNCGSSNPMDYIGAQFHRGMCCDPMYRVTDESEVVMDLRYFIP